MMDRGLWAMWYDLAVDARGDYFSWLEQCYIPAVLARPGVLWAAHYRTETQPQYSGKQGRITRTADPAVPGGTQFILLFGGETPDVFVNPVPADFHARLDDVSQRRLALRQGARSAIFVEQARVDGPAAGHGTQPVPCIQFGSYNCASYLDEDELNDWYAQWYLASCATVPGCVRARKLVSVSGWAKHAVHFEFESAEARRDHFLTREAAHPERAAWSDRVIRRLIHAPGSPAVARRIWPQHQNPSPK